MRWKAMCLYSSKLHEFFKATNGARSNLDFILCTLKIERKYKVKSTKCVIFHALHHIYCMKSYSKIPLKTRIFNFQSTKIKSILLRAPSFDCKKTLQFWRVEVQGFPTQLFLYKSDLKKLKIKSQTQNKKYFLEIPWRLHSA